jgi:ribulose-phosphate 3-epimerase
MKMIAPSLLAADFSKLGAEIAAVEQAGADLLHIDVMDGHFVPNITIGPDVVSSLRKCTLLPFDVHLMIEEPQRFLEDFAKAGSTMLTVHVEATRHLHWTVTRIRELGLQAGVSVNPATPLALVEEILPSVNHLLIMTVNPGFGGQPFIDAVLPKIRKARAMIDALAPHVSLAVDGGVTLENIGAIAASGADIYVAGTSIFRGGDYGRTIAAMKDAIGAQERSRGDGFLPRPCCRLEPGAE